MNNGPAQAGLRQKGPGIKKPHFLNGVLGMTISFAFTISLGSALLRCFAIEALCEAAAPLTRSLLLPLLPQLTSTTGFSFCRV